MTRRYKMNLKSTIEVCVLAWLLSGGFLMAKQVSPNWVPIKDETIGLQADFPHQPLEMTFDIPFQNTPPLGQIRFYSTPIPTGTLVLSIFTSPAITSRWLQKEKIYHFFEKILVPHLFFDPQIFYHEQTFTHQLTKHQGEKAAFFQISYEDHGTTRKLEGIAKIHKNVFYTYFYLAPSEGFDSEIAKRFFDSVHLTEKQ